MKFKSFLFVLSMAAPFAMSAQPGSPPENWHLLDKVQDGYFGVSADRAYRELLNGKKSQTVIVAVIDGGVDDKHEDLMDVLWNNPGETPGNGKDDDKNGFVDDVHGWNFIGGKDGQNVNHDQLEVTRLYAKYRAQFKNVDPSKLSKKDKKLYAKYLELEETVMDEKKDADSSLELYRGILNSVQGVVKKIGKDDITTDDLSNFDSEDPSEMRAVQILKSMMSEGATVKEIEEQIQGGVDYFASQAEYNYNPDLDVRHIVGDNYADSYEHHYGNNDIKGPEAFHGTHVAGIIGATRGNGIGIDGIANNVRIMGVRAVPDGDERDKDVANAIIYAVDNGALVVNMSFGKGYSWDKKAVDKAVKYAAKHDVLLVHAAGNSAQDNDATDNFPNRTYEKRGLFGSKRAKNWVEVGALSWKEGEDMAANFSNYGKTSVDLFAPGVAIYSTAPENEYRQASGTSMASPVVAGVAALVRSYYPELTAIQVKDVLMSTTTMTKNARVKTPGTGEIVPFTDLCITGGVVNAYEALKKAATVKGKKKLARNKA